MASSRWHNIRKVGVCWNICQIPVYEFDYNYELSCISGRCGVSVKLCNLAPYKYERRAAIVTMTT
jgi:hypothetical protein